MKNPIEEDTDLTIGVGEADVMKNPIEEDTDLIIEEADEKI
jgi:hypothetical protein